MDGITIVQKTLDPISEAVEFVRGVEQFRGLRGRVAKHSVRFFNLYRSKLNPLQLSIGFEQGLLLSAHTLMTSTTALGWLRKGRTRTYVSTTEALDDTYTPAQPFALAQSSKHHARESNAPRSHSFATSTY